MGSPVRTRDASARWTVKDFAQGKPFGHPSHALFVHFPVAFYIAALAADVASRFSSLPQAPLVASWLIAGGLLMTVPTAATGLLDWAGMTSGSSKHRVATRHMIYQVSAALVFLVVLALRWNDRAAARADGLWIAFDVVGVALLLVGQWLGGRLVYGMGMRVNTRGRN